MFHQGDAVKLDAGNDPAAMVLFDHFDGAKGVVTQVEGTCITVRFEDGETNKGHCSWFKAAEAED